MNKISVSLFIIGLAVASQAMAGPQKRFLHQGWKFHQQHSEIKHPAKVPGCIHLDLMNAQIIQDPFYRMNDRSVQWIDKEDWWYETLITPTAEELASENQTIVFEGLDTYADIYVNHQRVLQTDNMHRTYRLNVKGLLKEGENLLEVFFNSPIKRNIPKFDALDYRHNTGPDHSWFGGVFDKTLSPFARTAAFEYGWDWSSRFVTSGIWRPVYLETWNQAKVADAWYIQNKVNKKQADLRTVVTIEATEPLKDAMVVITANGKKVAQKAVNVPAGTHEVTIDYTIRNPRLWWTNGLGEQYLYDFKASLIRNGNTLDAVQHAIGLRSLILHNDKDKWGHNLYFELNGQPLYAKGYNMVPNDNFLARCTDSVYYQVVKDARDVNMNIIRVWGGGIYEDDAFYKYCDKMGILVWQDFMFACQTYEVDSAFLATIRQEAIDNVKRLRNHSCMAVYTGNNEEQDIWFGWGGKQKYFAERGQEERVWKMQHSIFYEVLPEVVRKYGGNITYRPSSPWAFENTASDRFNGDDHYWGVWHGGQPFDAYYDHHVRFESEYGFQSFPEYESVLQYAPLEQDHNIYSDVMMEHQNAGTYANRLIEQYMTRDYRVPTDFEKFLYVGQVLQADGVKIGMEAFRRNRPYCMGSIVWQLNDCWPVASWSSRDYYGRWKALHYVTKKAYDDILVSPRVKDATGAKQDANGEVANLPTERGVELKSEHIAELQNKMLEVKLVNDRRSAVKGTFRMQTMTLDGTTVYEKTRRLTMPANDAIDLDSMMVLDILGGRQPQDVIFYLTFTAGDKTYYNIAYPVKQKDMNYRHANITHTIIPAGDGYDVTLTTDIFARAVFMKIKGIDNFFGDNYFDMLPGTSRTIHVSSSKDAATFAKEFKVVTLGDTYTD